MEKCKDDFIVEKSLDLEISQFNDSNEYLITVKELGNRIVVNKKTLDLIELIDGKKSLADIAFEYNNQNPLSRISIDVLHKLFFVKLGRHGVIVNNENIKSKRRKVASYLYLNFTLINEKKLHYFIRIVSPLINYKYFYSILSLSFFVVLLTVITNSSELVEYSANIELKQWSLFFLFSGIVLFFHEFGHASSCKKLGAEPGRIGFGFYLLSPVMFADVSDIWKLKRRERIYVNFSGMYIEMVIALALTILYFITNNLLLLSLASIILFSFAINLNPFLRYDGYWILSDLADVPNLRKVSINKLRLFTKYILGKEDFTFSFKNLFLVIYAFVSVALIFLVIVYILITDYNSILSFPSDIFAYGIFVANHRKIALTDLTQFILPFLFYIIAGKFLIFWLFNKLKRGRNKLL